MQTKTLATVLRVLSSPKRLETLVLLMHQTEPLSTGMVSALLGQPDATVSYNLMTLASHGLAVRQPCGRFVFYVANRAMVQEVFKFFDFQGDPTPMTTNQQDAKRLSDALSDIVHGDGKWEDRRELVVQTCDRADLLEFISWFRDIEEELA